MNSLEIKTVRKLLVKEPKMTKSISPECVFFSSSCFEHNCLWLTSPGTFACAIDALFGPIRNTWLVPPGLIRATKR